jgi:thiamine-phosphate pyrophosphorylase
MSKPLLCYITDRSRFPGDEAARRQRLLAKIAEAARWGVDYIQLREKDLPSRDLEELAREAIRILRDPKLGSGDSEPRTVFLINSRTDVALATGAGGVHLPADDISSEQARQIWQRSRSCGAGAPARGVISSSCHQPSEVQQAARAGADLALFAPVFDKKDSPSRRPAGLDALREACQYSIPVLALGGVTLENAAACLAAGAAGIAAIRLFQENEITDVVRGLRAL